MAAGGGAPSFGFAPPDAAEPMGQAVAAAVSATKALFDEVFLIIRAAMEEEAHAELPVLYTSALQSDGQNLLRWLNQKAAEHAVFRRGIAQALLSPISEGTGDGAQTLVTWALRVHSGVPDALQTGMEDLIHSLLVLQEFKANFCSTFSQLYLELLERRHCNEMRPDLARRGGGSTRDVFVFSVQMFTVPSMAVELATDPKYGLLLPCPESRVAVQASGLLDGMLQWLMQHINASAPGPGGVRPVDVEAGGDDAAPPLDECVDVRARMLDTDAKAWRRMTIDMRYLLRHHCVAATLVRRPGAGGVSPFRTLIRILRRFQMADPVVRQRGEHVRYEPKAWQKTLRVIPYLFDIYLLALTFIYNPSLPGICNGPPADAGLGYHEIATRHYWAAVEVIFSKVLCIVTLCGKYARALTFEDSL